MRGRIAVLLESTLGRGDASSTSHQCGSPAAARSSGQRQSGVRLPKPELQSDNSYPADISMRTGAPVLEAQPATPCCTEGGMGAMGAF